MNDEIQRELHHTEGELETLQERCVHLEKETESFKTPKFEIENLIQARESYDGKTKTKTTHSKRYKHSYWKLQTYRTRNRENCWNYQH